MKYPFYEIIFLVMTILMIVWVFYNGEPNAMYMDSVPNTVQNLGQGMQLSRESIAFALRRSLVRFQSSPPRSISEVVITLACHAGIRSSILLQTAITPPQLSWLEQLICNHQVVSSNLTGGSILKSQRVFQSVLSLRRVHNRLGVIVVNLYPYP